MQEEIQTQENEICIPVNIQQKASLYGLASVLSGERVPNKKAMKKASKRLFKDVVAAIGRQGATELCAQNQGAVSMVFAGIRKDPNIDPVARRKLLAATVDDLLASYNIGIEKVLNS